MERLALIEVQLIMNYLTRVELTLFSRCSHRLFSDGDTDLAWRCQTLFTLPRLPFNRNEVNSWLSNVSSLTHCLFMRHQPRIRLILDSWMESDATLLNRLFQLIPRLERVTFGTMSWWEVFREQSQLHLTLHPSLTECKFDCTMDGKLSHLLAELQKWTNLRILTLPHGYGDWRREEADSAFGLQSLPGLTSLTFQDEVLESPRTDEGRTISTSIMKCERLTQIHIAKLMLSAIEFNRVCTSPHLSQLTELSISQWAWLDQSQISLCVESLRTTWRSLISLQHLSLTAISDLARFFTAFIPLGPQVRLLSISTYDTSSPSSNDFHQLLIASPQLFIEFSPWGIFYTKGEDDAVIQSLFDSLDASTQPRFKLVLG